MSGQSNSISSSRLLPGRLHRRNAKSSWAFWLSHSMAPTLRPSTATWSEPRARTSTAGRGLVSLLMPLDEQTEVEITLPGRYAIAPGVRDQISRTTGVEQVEEV